MATEQEQRVIAAARAWRIGLDSEKGAGWGCPMCVLEGDLGDALRALDQQPVKDSALGAGKPAAYGWRCVCGKAHLMENRPSIHVCTQCGYETLFPAEALDAGVAYDAPKLTPEQEWRMAYLNRPDASVDPSWACTVHYNPYSKGFRLVGDKRAVEAYIEQDIFFHGGVTTTHNGHCDVHPFFKDDSWPDPPIGVITAGRYPGHPFFMDDEAECESEPPWRCVCGRPGLETSWPAIYVCKCGRYRNFNLSPHLGHGTALDAEHLPPCPWCGSEWEISEPWIMLDPDSATANCTNTECWAHTPGAVFERERLLKLLKARPVLDGPPDVQAAFLRRVHAYEVVVGAAREVREEAVSIYWRSRGPTVTNAVGRNAWRAMADALDELDKEG